MIDLRTASLLDFLPESIASDPDVIAMAKALDPELQSVAQDIIQAVILPNIANITDENVLDSLAWAFRLNELQLWDDATIAGKQALLVNILAILKKSGTRFAVRRIFDLMSLVGVVVEWWEESAAAYTYRLRIIIDEIGITLSQLLQVSELTHRFESTRSQLSELGVESDRRAPLDIYPAVTVGRHTTISFGGP
jgi:phage tail P2-like protein